MFFQNRYGQNYNQNRRPGGFMQKVMRFMQGRYGMDALSKFMGYVAFGLILVNLVIGVVQIFANAYPLYIARFVLNGLVLVLIVLMYMRIFSRNTTREYFRNQKYLYYRDLFLKKWNRFVHPPADRKTHRIFKCPNCKQKIRIPKGRGKIAITCPKCKIEFIKKS